MTAAIEVVAMRPVGRGALQAVATVRLGPVLIHGVRVLQQDDGAPWIGLPQVPTRKGGAGWTAAVTIDDQELFAQIRTAVVEAWQSRADGS